MTGSIGALNLLDCLQVVRQLDAQTMPVWLQRTICLSSCLLAKHAPSVVCLASSAFFSELVSLTSAVFLLFTTWTRLLRASFRQISARFGPWFSSDLEREDWCTEQLKWENCHPVFFPSSVHPLRISRAAVRKESVWLCSFSRGSESRGSDMADVLPRPGSAASGWLQLSIPLLSGVSTSASVTQEHLIWGTTVTRL